MTPLGHASISFLVGASITKLFPSLPPTTVLAAITTGGVILDLDLFYRFYQKGYRVFDKTIGKHRFFPTHTPLFAFIVSIPIILTNFYTGIFILLGMIIHLLLDTLFFPEGINFTYPLNRKMYHLFTIKTHKFWAPKEVSSVNGWLKNYLTSPLFWVFEMIPTYLVFVVLFHGFD